MISRNKFLLRDASNFTTKSFFLLEMQRCLTNGSQVNDQFFKVGGKFRFTRGRRISLLYIDRCTRWSPGGVSTANVYADTILDVYLRHRQGGIDDIRYIDVSQGIANSRRRGRQRGRGRDGEKEGESRFATRSCQKPRFCARFTG